MKSADLGIADGSKIAVVGAGTMGGGIAQVAAQAGHPVVLFDVQSGVARAALERIQSNLDRRVERGRLDAQSARRTLHNIQPCDRSDGLSVLRGAVLIIEAIVEDLDTKKRLLQELDTIVDDDVILASNTSSLSITALAEGVRRPERVVGFHFFNPAPAMKLVEIVRGLQTDPMVCQRLAHTATSWGKVPVQARSTPGFIVNRIARPFYAEALRAIESGVAAAPVIDTVFEAAGFRMGPCRLMDIIGLDVNFAVTQSVYEGFFNDPRYRPALLQREMVSGGLLGQKSGQGFYQYGDDVVHARPAPMPVGELASTEVVVHGDLGIAQPLLDRLSDVVPLRVHEKHDAGSGCGWLSVGNIHIALTDGRPALERAAGSNTPTMLFDLVADYARCDAIAVAASDDRALSVGAALLQAAGFNVYVVADHPGLLLMRTVALLANEAYEAVATQVATEEDIDQAMTLGVNYPKGPIGWSTEVGLDNIARVIGNLGRLHEPDRYRLSLALRHELWRRDS